MKDTKLSAVQAFLARCAGALGVPVNVYENPTEEIADAAQSRRPIKLFAAGQGMLAGRGGARARLEENYLFDTRRFAGGTAIAPGEYVWFANAVGLPASNNGFSTGLVMTDVETNMDTPSQIPQGKDFVLTNIGLSLNAGVTAADAALILEMGALRFEKQGGQFTLKHGPGILWPGGTGLGVSTGNAANGVADIRATRKLAVPRVLRQRETFIYKYVVPRAVSSLDASTVITPTNSVLLRIWLWGGQQDAIPV